MSTKSGGFGWLWIVGLLAVLVLFKMVGMGVQSDAVQKLAPIEEPNPFEEYAQKEPNPFAKYAPDPARTVPQSELDRVNADMKREQQVRRDARILADELQR